MAVYSDHQPQSPCWNGLNTGQAYRLRLRVWDQGQGDPGPCGGTLACNEWDYQQLIENAGGAAGCFNAISLPVTTMMWCDFTAIPLSQRDMHLELRLLALNNQSLGEPFYQKISKSLDHLQISLMLVYS